jgi:hypothetical protein
MANERILILAAELDRITEYVSRVPHRSTGGYLLGQRLTRAGVDYLLIIKATTRVPDDYLSDGPCINHPSVTAEDVARALAGVSDGRFLGRWHAHLDGLTRPSSADVEWAISTFADRRMVIDLMLHGIACYDSGDVKVHPYLITREKMTYQKTTWQIATMAEIDDVRYNRPARVDASRMQATVADPEFFSIKKALELFRAERVAVEKMAHVRQSALREENSSVCLHVELAVNNNAATIDLTGDSLYPVQPPHLDLRVNDKPFNFTPRVLAGWTSACRLQDIVAEIDSKVERFDLEEMLPPPVVSENDPVKREIAILRAVRYTVNETVTPRAGTLLLVTSPQLEQTGTVFYAILPPLYPREPPAWALAARGIPFEQVDFEKLEEVPPHFTLLTWLEKQLPSLRHQRELASRRRGAPISALLVFYIFLFFGSSALGYYWQISSGNDTTAALARLVDTVRRAFSDQAGGLAPANNHSTAGGQKATLEADKPVLVVIIDAGRNTNLSPPEAEWAVNTALRPIRCESLAVDLKDQAKDVESVNTAVKGKQAIILFTYGAGDRQLEFLDALRPIGLPMGVISMQDGPDEESIRSTATFYRAAERPGGKGGAQRSLLALKKNGAIVINGAGASSGSDNDTP